jgi:hypothetical protein
VKEGEKVTAGQQLTEGSLNPHRILRILGREACELYLLTEVQKVYRSQGQNINDKHFEVITRKMLSKVQITSPGDTDLLPGDLVDRLYLQELNEQLSAVGKHPARAIQALLGVTKASLSTESFLSASSFQHTIKVLARAAIEGKGDPLFGLKENVIIGKLIPAGTGFPGEAAVLHDERLDGRQLPAGAGGESNRRSWRPRVAVVDTCWRRVELLACPAKARGGRMFRSTRRHARTPEMKRDPGPRQAVSRSGGVPSSWIVCLRRRREGRVS